MPRAIWTGTISFGLVNVPVKLFSATNERTVRFNQINSETGNRVSQPKVDAETREEIEFEKIAKGYEVTPDRYIIIDPAELDAIAPKKTKQIGIEKFVDQDEIDPMVYAKSYYLGPNTGGAKSYALLMQAMERSGRVAIGRLVIRSKESLVALRVRDSVIVCSTLCFADEINPTGEIARLDGQAETSETELAMAAQLVDSLTGEFDHAAYRDEYRQAVMDLIEKKAAGEEINLEPAVLREETPDLMGALEASIEQAKPKAPAKKAALKALAT